MRRERSRSLDIRVDREKDEAAAREIPEREVRRSAGCEEGREGDKGEEIEEAASSEHGSGGSGGEGEGCPLPLLPKRQHQRGHPRASRLYLCSPVAVGSGLRMDGGK